MAADGALWLWVLEPGFKAGTGVPERVAAVRALYDGLCAVGVIFVIFAGQAGLVGEHGEAPDVVGELVHAVDAYVAAQHLGGFVVRGDDHDGLGQGDGLVSVVVALVLDGWVYDAVGDDAVVAVDLEVEVVGN